MKMLLDARLKRGRGGLNRFGSAHSANRRLRRAIGDNVMTAAASGSCRKIRGLHRRAKQTHEAQVEPGDQEAGIARKAGHAPDKANSGAARLSVIGDNSFNLFFS